MRIPAAAILALLIGAATANAQSQPRNTGRWCVINASDNAPHCYFRRHADCMKAIADGSGVCVPSERRRGESLDK